MRARSRTSWGSSTILSLQAGNCAATLKQRTMWALTAVAVSLVDDDSLSTDTHLVSASSST